MSSCKVSVIIPVHNCGLYLQQCLHSVLQQTLSAFEIILINDASSDNSQAIIDNFSTLDNRVLGIELKQNKGVSVARNIGIEKASGEYLIFLDGDDYWDKDTMLQQLYENITRVQADFICFGFCRVNDTGEISQIKTYKPELINLRQQKNWLASYNIWAKLISRKMVISKDIRFEQTWGEDALFSISLYCHAEKALIIDDVFYCYRQNSEGESQVRWHSEKLLGTVNWFTMAIELIRSSVVYEHYPEMLQTVIFERLSMLFNKLGSMAIDTLSEQEQLHYFSRWAQCFEYLDTAAFNTQFKESDDYRNYQQLLDLLKKNDYKGINTFFSSDTDRNRFNRKQEAITITLQQAVYLGNQILNIDKPNIDCDFGNGSVISLAKEEAHQLARLLIANKEATLTLKFD